MSASVALIVAAGRGSRLGPGMPKQYRRLAGVPILRRAAMPFLDHPRIDAVRVVIHADDAHAYADAVADLALLPPVTGGATRQDSVRLGLESFAAVSPARVLIHDAARAFVDAATIGRVIDALDDFDGAIPALPVIDTLKRAGDGDGDGGAVRIGGTVERAGLWRAQTPQGFRFPALLAAHRRCAGLALTDDAAVGEHAGLRIVMVPGHEDNLKVTTEEDLQRGARLIESTFETRTASGFDVHRFGDGDAVMLCGVTVPHSHGLLGHSDADVGLHALTDALLGTIAAGDIGSHFPPSEPRWRGAPSEVFLRLAAELIAAASGAIVNVDVTLICERPKVGPHREAMRARIAEILAIPTTRVSVKATTTEELGFTGRREGIAAQASASVRLPRAD
ncbi:MAG: bifunctional 2-C-methyl-D-erythritol 4-phosphate cytidylyltransferase/2-C-methyl-D-erythritol 2,4-cyclodiphosphate synthase [Rhodospirillales bacterium]|nr:bifunctional 2-C-methyl-D-erythritol 4-phosphate cytidylyltransferase/2-C-methyl-D-erythritol 2,4-cyclodiphosphate synthase [Rhodospirillales bacterium]